MKLGVVGSINIDMVYKLSQFLKQGETRFGSDFQVLMGGKGANQAVMMSALNDHVVFLGAVGQDSFGEDALKHLKQKNHLYDGFFCRTCFIQTQIFYPPLADVLLALHAFF